MAGEPAVAVESGDGVATQTVVLSDLAARSRLRVTNGAPVIPAGMKLRGANIVPKPNGPKVGGGTGPQGWTEMWSEWDWSGWIKPQIDAAKAAGANAIRFIGDAAGPMFYSRSTSDFRSIPLATYLARTRQWIEYCASVGLYAYPCGGDFDAMPHAADLAGVAFTQAETIDVLAAWAATCDHYEHVIGLDLIQEPFYAMVTAKAPTGVATDAAMHTYLAAVLAGVRSSTSLPLTFSWPGSATNITAAQFGDTTNLTTSATYMDFFDFHVYYAAAVADIAPALTYGKAVIVGETGSPVSAGTGVRELHYQALALVAARDDIAATFAWAITDQQPDTNTAGQYGLYTAAFVARATEIAAFATWPIRPVNIATTIYSRPTDFDALVGSPVRLPLGGNRRIGWMFDGSTDESIASSFFAPPNWNTVRFSLLWANTGAGNGLKVTWAVLLEDFAAGDTLNVGDSQTQGVLGTAGPQDELRESTINTVFTVTPGLWVPFRVRRTGTDASDTLVSDAALVGVKITRVT